MLQFLDGSLWGFTVMVLIHQGFKGCNSGILLFKYSLKLFAHFVSYSCHYSISQRIRQADCTLAHHEVNQLLHHGGHLGHFLAQFISQIPDLLIRFRLHRNQTFFQIMHTTLAGGKLLL